MQNILVPIDFSPVSENALKYAVQLAKKSNGRIYLYHSVEIPAVYVDGFASTMPLNGFYDEMNATAETKLNDLGEKLVDDLLCMMQIILGPPLAAFCLLSAR